MVYIILFRGVGGATQLPTAALRKALTEAGFDSVATYINSGNAVVKSRMGAAKVTETIAEVCRNAFGFDKDIYAMTKPAWSDLIDSNPFPEAVSPGKWLHAAVLADQPKKDAVAALAALAAENGDRVAVVNGIAYLHTPNGFGTSKLAARFDKGIGVGNTARNWNTVLKLHELAEKLG